MEELKTDHRCHPLKWRSAQTSHILLLLGRSAARLCAAANVKTSDYGTTHTEHIIRHFIEGNGTVFVIC